MPTSVASVRLRIPAIGLMVSSILALVVLSIIGVVETAATLLESKGGVDLKRLPYWDIMSFSLLFIGNLVILAGARSMRSGRRYRLCYAAAIVACVPVLTPLFAGVLFGVWALILLHRQDVKVLFAEGSKPSPRSP